MMNSTDLKMIEKILDTFGFQVNVSFDFDESQVIVSKKETEKITVEYHKPASNNDAYYFGFKISNLTFDREKAGKYLAQQLENYLNDESKSV
jgi:hypothetical protein